MYNILVCDDDKDIVEAIQIYLSAEGYHIIKAYNGKEAIDIINTAEIHLALLDIMMPQMDGIRVTMKLRENNSTLPILLLTAKSEDSDKVLGLNVGADDYITKPFNPLELIARVKSALRRYTKLGSIVAEEQNIYSSGELVVNDDRKEVYVDDELIKLTPIEYNLLKLLVKNKGRVFSINEIYELIWNEPSYGADNIVAVHIRHIREKIEINPKEPKYLKVAWGIGYKVEKY